jgi:hypothetical protein
MAATPSSGLLQSGQWYDFSRVQFVPRDPGVYFFRAQNAPNVYIGKADRLRDRLQDHLRCIEIVQELSATKATWEFRFIASGNPSALEYVALKGYANKVNRRETGEQAFREVERLAHAKG